MFVLANNLEEIKPKSLAENHIDVFTAQTLDEALMLKEDWTRLLQSSKKTNIYVDPDFFFHVFEARHKNTSPHIVLFKKGNKPLALLVGAGLKYNVPCWLGYLNIKTPALRCLDIENGGLITDGSEEAQNILTDYLDSLLKNKQIDLLLADHLSSLDPFWDVVSKGLYSNKKAIYREGIEWIDQLRDIETGEVIDKHKHRTRVNFRRKDKKLLKFFNEEVKLKEFTSVNEAKIFLTKAAFIGKKSYQHALGVDVKNDLQWRQLLESFSEGNYFRGYILCAQNNPIAYAFGLAYKDIFYLYATAYDPQYRKIGPGGYLVRRLIEKMTIDNFNYLHFGYGDADFKQLYGTDSHKEATFRIYGKTKRAKYSKLVDLVTTQTTEEFSKLMDSLGLLNMVKRSWRMYLENKNN